MFAAIRTTFAVQWDHLVRRAERRLPSLTRHRLPEPLPIRLHQRRVYVLPARFGVFFALIGVTMLLGALNFNNNAAMLFTFALAGVVLISLPRTVAHLERVTLASVRADPVFAGTPIEARLRLLADDGRSRPRLRLQRDEGDRADRVFDLDGTNGIDLPLTLATSRRGLLPLGRCTFWTDYPFGIFHAWSVMNPDVNLLVYPRPEPSGPPLPESGRQGEARTTKPHGEDWQGLREFRPGDPLRLIAWKASAREERLLVKEFAEPRGAEVVLDWAQLAALEPEARIARLARWVLLAEAEQRLYRLVLPLETIGPGLGQAQCAASLTALALLP
jgi:uncharacterized protein (DUF58 family)